MGTKKDFFFVELWSINLPEMISLFMTHFSASLTSTQSIYFSVMAHRVSTIHLLYWLLQNVYVNINRILSVASRLIESNHYAGQHVRTVAGRLDRTWKEFAASLDERTSVLSLSVLFHHKAEQVRRISSIPFQLRVSKSLHWTHSEPSQMLIIWSVLQYVENVPTWSQACENMSIPSEIIVLETAIHQHQNLYESMCQAYTEVSIAIIILTSCQFFSIWTQLGKVSWYRKASGRRHLSHWPTVVSVGTICPKSGG